MSKSDLKIDWATHAAAKHACLNWHYSKCLPAGKLVKVGAWEKGKFIGVVLFGRGATPRIGSPYGLNQDECVELVRIALTGHVNSVSRISALAVKFLVKTNPNLRLVVSFADQSQGHHGGIYQAGNWIYSGAGAPSRFWMIKGKITHPRTVIEKGGSNTLAGAKNIDGEAYAVKVPGKHRYLMPLDKEMKERILLLSKPYPKRDKQAMVGTTDTAEGQHLPSRSTSEEA